MTEILNFLKISVTAVSILIHRQSHIEFNLYTDTSKGIAMLPYPQKMTAKNMSLPIGVNIWKNLIKMLHDDEIIINT